MSTNPKLPEDLKFLALNSRHYRTMGSFFRGMIYIINMPPYETLPWLCLDKRAFSGLR